MVKKMFRNAAISAMAASATVAAVAPAVSADDVNFSDLNEANPHYDAVVDLVQQGAIQGYDDSSFKPFKDVNRGQTAKILAEALDLDTPNNVSEILNQYNDVNADSDYAGYIAAVTKAGIFSGDEDNNFNLWDHINREQMAKVVVEAFDLQKYYNGEEADLNTESISPDFVPYVQTLANLEITDQLEDYDSWTEVPRDQFSSFVVRSQDVQAGKPSIKDLETNVNEDNQFTISGDATDVVDAVHLIVRDEGRNKIVANRNIYIDVNNNFAGRTNELDDGEYIYKIMGMENGKYDTENVKEGNFRVESEDQTDDTNNVDYERVEDLYAIKINDQIYTDSHDGVSLTGIGNVQYNGKSYVTNSKLGIMDQGNRGVKIKGDLMKLLLLSTGDYSVKDHENPYIDGKINYDPAWTYGFYNSTLKKNTDFSIYNERIYESATESKMKQWIEYKGKSFDLPEEDEYSNNPHMFEYNHVPFFVTDESVNTNSNLHYSINDLLDYWDIDAKISIKEDEDGQYLHIER